MFRKCCVPNCNSLRKDVKMHKFPANEMNRTRWLQAIGFENISSETLKNMHICHKHFEQRFVNEHTNHLKCDAYPTLFRDTQITSVHSSIHQQSDLEMTICSVQDHTYSKKYRADHSYSLPNTTKEHTVQKVAHRDVNVTRTVVSKEYSVADVASSSTTIADTAVICNLASTEHPIIDVASSSTAIPVAEGSICKTPQKLGKKRLLRDVKSLTPRCRLFYNEYKRAKRHNNYNNNNNKALAFSKENSLEELIKNMNPLSKKVLHMQLKLCTKNKMARRYTREEKLIALSIYKQGPKSYKFLQKIFILPSKTTLKKMIRQLNLNTGINPQIFEQIKQQVAKWDHRKKICTVIFDEMAIETALTYLPHKDHIVGFVDLTGKIDQFADHALVFMLRGAVFKWQQPIAFYFCEGATSSLQLKEIIQNIIAAVTNTGLIPIALVSDQGPSFQCAVNSLLDVTKRNQLRAEETVDNTIHLSGLSISVIYDPPHLLKGIRNNLLTKDMLFEGKRVTWNDILDVYNVDCKHGESRILHKLTDQHVIPEKIKKMKVKNCVHVFSKSVSAALSYTSAFPVYPDGRPTSKTLKNTAEAVSFFDDLFDSVNGAKENIKGKNLRTLVTSKSIHHKFWKTAIKTLEGIKFFTKDGTLKNVPTLKNWVITLKSFMRLWELLASLNIKIMRPRYFNSDPIENFFGQVRAYNYRSNDPTINTFINTFKALLVTRFIYFHSENYNCEEDASQGILNIQSLFENNTTPSPPSSEPEKTKIKNVVFNEESLQVQARRERLNVHSRAYTAGWVTRKILAQINCKNCKTNLLSESNAAHLYIKQKEYKTKNQRKLSYPSENVITSIGNIIKTTNEYLEHQGHHSNISDIIKQEICSKYSFEFLDCPLHREVVLENFLKISIKLFIFNWCSVINRILKGTDIIRAEKCDLQPMQKKALLKYKKKLKNKQK